MTVLFGSFSIAEEQSNNSLIWVATIICARSLVSWYSFIGTRINLILNCNNLSIGLNKFVTVHAYSTIMCQNGPKKWASCLTRNGLQFHRCSLISSRLESSLKVQVISNIDIDIREAENSSSHRRGAPTPRSPFCSYTLLRICVRRAFVIR